jgi:CelD/BcsL family acetyltransferase involved in cellulose biosynthesis
MAAQVRATSWKDFVRPNDIARWDALSLMACEPNPFFESWYLLPSLRAFDPSGRIALLRVEANGALIGLMPLGRPRSYYGHPLPHLGSWIHANCFLGCPLVATGAEEQFWHALLGWADRHAGAALFLHLARLAEDGPLYRALRRVLADQGRPAAVVHRKERAMLSSPLSPQDYFEQSLSGKKRKELRRQSNRLSEEGEVALHRQPDADGIDHWADEFLALEAAGWKGAAGSALASDAATASLFREALHGAAQRGRLERLSMTLDGRAIAMLANFITAPGAFSYKTAFDEAYARFSPGVLLQQENLAMLDRSDIAWCDSCAAQDHPMIDHIWRERRAIARISIAIGGKARRALFRPLIRAETGAYPGAIA